MDRGQFVQRRRRRQTRCVNLEPVLQRHLQAVGQEGHEDVRFHAPVQAITPASLLRDGNAQSFIRQGIREAARLRYSGIAISVDPFDSANER